MSRIDWAALPLLCLLSFTPAHAASVKIDGDNPSKDITIVIEDATVDLVLEDLRQKYGFEVGGLQFAAKADALTATLSGDLRSVVERLLRNWNYVIVSSPQSKSGIKKVLIIDAKFGAQPSTAKSANGEDPQKMMQAQSGAE